MKGVAIFKRTVIERKKMIVKEGRERKMIWEFKGKAMIGLQS